MYRIMQIIEYASHWRAQLDIPGFHPTINLPKEKLGLIIPQVNDRIYLDQERMFKFLIPKNSMLEIGAM